ncbi:MULTISPECIES: hypothetical protein [Cupriavidus]|uniref:hypothetical protein n=1 Tax=Cupriavidus sp. DF5525 TaxID=3160989 RepID=UPI0003B0886E|nr:hypothetical protein N234_32005 [Ralstonia pickettii DTP0602]
MSIGLLAAVMAALLFLTVLRAIWRCSHPYRMRYRRCIVQKRRMGLGRQAPRRHYG